MEDCLPDPPGSNLSLTTAADVQDSLLVVTNDLDRLQRLLGNATETLMGHFYGASTQLRLAQQIGACQPASANAALSGALTHLGGAVTALQFEDMATQLVAHTTLRLRRCVDRLGIELMGEPGDGPDAIEAAPLRPNPVTQDEVDAGSIDLF